MVLPPTCALWVVSMVIKEPHLLIYSCLSLFGTRTLPDTLLLAVFRESASELTFAPGERAALHSHEGALPRFPSAPDTSVESPGCAAARILQRWPWNWCVGCAAPDTGLPGCSGQEEEEERSFGHWSPSSQRLRDRGWAFGFSEWKFGQIKLSSLLTHWIIFFCNRRSDYSWLLAFITFSSFLSCSVFSGMFLAFCPVNEAMLP